MTQEDIYILIADLCGRLPYGLIIKCNDGFRQSKEKLVSIDVGNGLINYDWRLTDIKSYLRPMSSMTKEEKVEYCDLQAKFLLSSQNPVTDGYALFDWLNKNMFDFRGLIPKDLALSTEEFNPYKN